MTRRLYMVRHGPTHAKGLVGWSNLGADLSDRAAIARLDAHLPRSGLLQSSDLSRAVATADTLQAGRRRLAHERDLREMHFGQWELRTSRDLMAADRERAQAFWDRPGDVRPPGGELWSEMVTRASRAIDRLLAAHPGQDVVVVAHMGVILSQVQRLTGIDTADLFAQTVAPLSVTEFAAGETPTEVTLINHCP